ncbi:hypothetical protein [Mycobacterium sp. ITM-2016-00318]|uniref:hypothetical protein n=1 Tax=Mycobacterium sp. ITM-2016-00318 TaxID=2099693 RepID=UPI000CFA15F3|nr:hypothetical protein [Mycobacterium sp. ITM-2016-00318]WNG93191.1 hypothetical protein C6A82_001490 [Mycobacterium sp. ITM-2016-00318]
MPKRITAAATLVLGAAAGAIIALAPIASAEPPPCNPDDVPCQQQQKPPDPAAIVGSATDQANHALNQAPAASPYPTSGAPGGVCMRMNGFPIYIPPGGIPSEMASSGIPSGPVHAGNCTAEDTFVGGDVAQQGSDAAQQIVGAATPPQDQQQPPAGQ